MIKCSVCGQENDDLSVTCVRCKSFLQSKVDNLDLFATIWLLIETPRTAMRKIAIARHKNYILLLTALFGIGVAYSLLWYKNLGPRFANLLTLSGTGLLVGPVLGLALLALFTLVIIMLGRAMGGKATWRATYAIVAYSTVPIALSLVIIYPIEIAIFGMYFFDNNPPPLVINPVAYIVLLGLDSLCVLWSWLLLVEGAIVVHGFMRGKAAIAALGVLAVVGAAVVGIARI